MDANNNPLRTINSNYDAASQLTDIADSDSAYSYDYDLAGRLSSVDNAGTSGVPDVVFNYNYDAVNNLTQVRDSIDGIAKGLESFQYDALDRVTKITQSGNGVSDKRVDMSYDAASQMTGMSRYSDLTGNNLIAESNYTFDAAGRLTNLVHGQDGNVLSAYQWAYDAANRITQTTNPDGVADYNYDNTDQLTQADHDDQADENYSYDQNGNRTNAGYVTGANNQLLSDGTYNYEYDAEGNRLKRIEIANGEITEYEWDYRNRLVGVVTKNSSGNVVKDADYTYDVFDRRIAKSVDADGDGVGEAVVERFVYDGEHIALTFDGEGNQTERFLHGTQIDQVLAQENENGEVFWALADNIGSVRMLLDNDGNVVNQVTYDAFGRITSESNPSVDFRFGYVGKELDPETGLRHNGARYVDGDRFISEDPIGFDGGDANLYRYVNNSPLNYVDPEGFCSVALGGEPDGDNNNNLGQDISEWVFGEPAEATTPDLNYDFPGDDTVEVAGISIDDLLKQIWGRTTGTTQFEPKEKTRNRLGQLTDGDHFVIREAQIPHENGQFRVLNEKTGKIDTKSQFLKQYTGESADTLVLDAAAVADNLGLWTNDKGERVENGRKAKIFIENGPIGVLGTGQPTSWLTIHRRLGGGVHGHPSAARNETFEDTYNDSRSNKVR